MSPPQRGPQPAGAELSALRGPGTPHCPFPHCFPARPPCRTGNPARGRTKPVVGASLLHECANARRTVPDQRDRTERGFPVLSGSQATAFWLKRRKDTCYREAAGLGATSLPSFQFNVSRSLPEGSTLRPQNKVSSEPEASATVTIAVGPL